jgi:hypothetical protein
LSRGWTEGAVAAARPDVAEGTGGERALRNKQNLLIFSSQAADKNLGQNTSHVLNFNVFFVLLLKINLFSAFLSKIIYFWQFFCQKLFYFQYFYR